MANTGDTAVDMAVITKEWATYGHSRNTYISAVQFQCSVSREITFKEVATHSTIILTLYFTILWMKEG